ncbi:MAG: tRNA epoxyqueuosine(34) reductase QueG [Phycisphaerae bacterium]
MGISEAIKQKALELGFDAVGITDASAIDFEHQEYLENWLKAGFAGQMSYMHRNFEKRINPAELLEGASSVIVCALNIKPREEKIVRQELNGRVANYARYDDYHIFIKKLLHKLADFAASQVGGKIDFKICVDSVPLAERAVAQRAGVGFIGKNHMLINPSIGPAMLLGEIITTIDLDADEPLKINCEGCNKCIEACPSGALMADGRFDANKCISYLTIEYKGKIAAELAEKIGNRLFGCDECVLACPYYERGPVCANKNFKFYPERGHLDLNDILKMSSEQFDAKFDDSPIHRSGAEVLKRNAAVCLDNIRRR